PTSLREIEQWARASGDWQGLIAAFQARLDSRAASADERRYLRMKLAEVSATQAGRPEDAIGAYRDLIDNNPDDEEASAALDRLLRAAPDRRDDLRWLFRHRADRGEGAGRIAVLAEWAILEEEAFGAAERATAIYREILDLAPSDLRALRALA